MVRAGLVDGGHARRRTRDVGPCEHEVQRDLARGADGERQAGEASAGEVRRDEVLRKPGVRESGEHRRQRSLHAAHGAAALGTQEALVAALRECHEEIGQLATTAERVASLYPSPGYTTEVMHFYKLTGLHVPDHTAEQDEDEHLEPRTFGLDELRALVAGGEITDMKTVAALQWLK